MILLRKEIEKLNKRLLRLSAIAVEGVAKSIRAVEERDYSLAVEIVRDDSVIDELEVEIEEECLKILALHQPVASDLRFIVTMLKINNDLERVGDLACSIARRALLLVEQPAVNIPFDLHNMGTLAKKMIEDSVEALVNLDRDLAQRLLVADKQIDRLHRENYDFIRRAILENPTHIDSYVVLMTVSRSLERIGDHATNIAEDVIYLLDGNIVRHAGRKDKERPQTPKPKLP